MDIFLTWDRDLFLLLNNWGNASYDSFWLLLSNKLTNVVVYLLAWFYLLTKVKLKPALFLFIATLILVLITDQFTNLAKYSFARLRPCYDPELLDVVRLVKASCGGQYGFFSGHSSNSFALAAFFSALYRQKSSYLPLFFYMLAALIALSRVYLGVHFPLDILVGAIVGILIGKGCFRVFNKFISLEYR